MQSNKLIIPLLLGAVLLSACSSQTAPGQSGQPAKEKVTYADAPEGCSKSTKLTAKTSDLKETSFTSVSNWYNVSASAPEKAQLVFGTFDIPKDNIWNSHTYTDSDARVVVYFENNETKKAGVGVYPYSTDKEVKVKAREVDVSSKNLSGAVFDKTGSLEITYLDSKYACGTMKFDDGYSLLKGSFIAQVNQK